MWVNFSLIPQTMELLNVFQFILTSVFWTSPAIVSYFCSSILTLSGFSSIRLDVGIDIQDDLGRHEVGFHDNTMKIDEKDGVGCRLNASFSINRVPGNFHISTHSASSQPLNGDMKHVIHDLTFGDSIKVRWDQMFSFSSILFLRYFSSFFDLKINRDFEKFRIDALFTHYVVLTIPIGQVMFRTIIWWKSFPQFMKISVLNDAIPISIPLFIGWDLQQEHLGK